MTADYVFLVFGIPLILLAAWKSYIVSGTLLITTVFLAIDYFRTKDPTFSHKLALQKYIIYIYAYVYGFYLNWKLKRDASDIEATQTRSLLAILKLNGNTEYSRKWKLAQVKSREEFRKVHPLSEFKQFESYINRTAEGENNVIVSETPVFFGSTSGTTGKPNLIPLLASQFKEFKKYYCLVVYNLSGLLPSIAPFKRVMKLYYNPQRCLDRTPSGILSGPASAKFTDVTTYMYTSPPAGFDIEKETPCRYVHVLFGLRHRQLTKIETIFAPIVFYAMEEIEREWKNLVKDIRDGTLKADLDIPNHTRKLLEENLFPDPQRADELEKEFKKGFHHIAKRIWPKLVHISCIKSGPFANYARLLKEKYTDDILIYDSIYGATEGVIGMDIWPKNPKPAYLLWPWLLFFEFIKVENISEKQPETLFMDQLELGKEYEIVLTTPAGLTRYRFGDVVKVVRFFHQMPVVEFQYRSGHLLNIRGEKMSDVTFSESLTAIVAEMPSVQRVVDYSICTNISLPNQAQEEGELPYYAFFVELTTTGVTSFDALEKELSEKVDKKVMENHPYYRFYREKNALAPLKIFLIKPAGFTRLRGFMLDNSKTSPSQLKIPRALVKPTLIEFIYGEKIRIDK